MRANSLCKRVQVSQALSPKAAAPARLEDMGLFALSKMLDPAHILSTIIPMLESSEANASGCVSKAEFTRVLRSSIPALTSADCDKVFPCKAAVFCLRIDTCSLRPFPAGS